MISAQTALSLGLATVRPGHQQTTQGYYENQPESMETGHRREDKRDYFPMIITLLSSISR